MTSVVANVRIMTRMGTEALEMLGTDGDFVPCQRGSNALSDGGRRLVTRWHGPMPTNPGLAMTNKRPLCISRSSASQKLCSLATRSCCCCRIWSYGSGYGGALLVE